eukprot:TRINITY_DN313_c0_g1_i1.p1 TRINITY_DN313_c0_g1~~TRINITY_DN313_c0_g1_i1.p1  ORF type:complete len:235 (+),score=39.90 TRINITY_DN313_c0_g1_i1:87-791(+)
MNLAKTEIQEQNPKKKRQSPMIKKRNVTSNEERDIPNRGRNPQRSTSGNELQRDIFRDRHNKRVHGANRVGEGAEEARKAEISRDFKWGDGRRGEAIGGAIGEAIGELIIYLAISFVEMVVLLVVVLSFGWYSRNSYRPDGIGEGRGAFGSLFQNIRWAVNDGETNDMARSKVVGGEGQALQAFSQGDGVCVLCGKENGDPCEVNSALLDSGKSINHKRIRNGNDIGVQQNFCT